MGDPTEALAYEIADEFSVADEWALRYAAKLARDHRLVSLSGNLRAQNERLREALEEIVDDCEHSGTCADGMAAALADIERRARDILNRYRETDGE